MIKKCKIRFEPHVAPNAHVNLIDEQFIALITEINVIGDSDGRWLDIGSFRHVYYDCAMFKTYTNKKVFLGVCPHHQCCRYWRSGTESTFEKIVILKDAMYTLEIVSNLISDFLLNKAWFSQSIGVDLYTVVKNDIFAKLLRLRLLRMKLKFNSVTRLREFIVIRELNIISFFLMNFINNVELYMKRLHHILLK